MQVKNAGESISSHSYNTFIGAQSARNVVGERGVYLGYDAGEGVASSATGNIMIGMESRILLEQQVTMKLLLVTALQVKAVKLALLTL